MINIHSDLVQKEMATLGSNAFCVLLAISSHISPLKRDCFPSRARLKKITGLGDEAVRNAIKKLSENGYLKMDQSRSSGAFDKTIYTITTPHIGVFMPINQVEVVDMPGGDEPHAVPPGGGQPHAVEPDTADPLLSISNKEIISHKEDIVHSAEWTSSSSPIDTKGSALTEGCEGEELSKAKGSAKTLRVSRLRVEKTLTGFDELWELYDFKRSKPDAIKAFAGVKDSEIPAVIEGVKAYLAFLKIPENSFRQQKILGAFLRGRMWEDDWTTIKAEVDEDPTELTESLEKAYNAVKTNKLATYPNLKDVRFLSRKEFKSLIEVDEDFLGPMWRVHVSPDRLKGIISEAFGVFNSLPPYKRKDFSGIFEFIKSHVKSIIYHD